MMRLEISLLCAVLFCIFLLGRKRRRYKATSYYQMTKNPYGFMMKDKGSFGEYRIYRSLISYERKGAKFLFNCYLPKYNGETTEADVIMVHHSGIYVFESKNYSGWIYGHEKDRTWTQSLRGDYGHFRKEQFLNPFIQNQSHIAGLKKTVGCKSNIPVYSLTVFSDRCKLKKVTVTSPDRQATTWRKLRRTVGKFAGRSPDALGAEELEVIYRRLYPYTQVSRREKRKHIRNIQKRWKRRSFW